MLIAQPGQWPCKSTTAAGEACVLVLNHPGPHASVSEAAAAPPAPVMLRAYRGRTQAEAGIEYSVDAGQMASAGYRPVNQVWAAAGMARPLVTLLALVVLGFVIYGYVGAGVGVVAGLLYIVVVPQKGTLTVTYAR